MLFRKKNPYLGMFRDWKFEEHRVTYIDEKSGNVYGLWTSNGFAYFRDDEIIPVEPFLAGINVRDRKLMWKALQEERSYRKRKVIPRSYQIAALNRERMLRDATAKTVSDDPLS